MNNSSDIRWFNIFAQNTYSFVFLSPKFKNFKVEEQGVIPYVETKKNYVGIGDPVGPFEVKGSMFEKFSHFADEAGKKAVLLPVGEHTRLIAEKNGYRSVKIGEEAVIDLASHELSLVGFASSRRLSEEGAQLTTKFYSELSLKEKADIQEFEESTNTVLQNRFLGVSDDAEGSELAYEKKFLLLYKQKQLISLIVAVPIPVQKGWYFSKFLVVPEAPEGTLELAVILALRSLKELGFSYVSLGLVPFRNVNLVTFRKRLHNQVSRLYGASSSFAEQYEFYARLMPTHWKPQYAVYQGKVFSALNAVFLLSSLEKRKRVSSPGVVPSFGEISRNRVFNGEIRKMFLKPLLYVRKARFTSALFLASLPLSISLKTDSVLPFTWLISSLFFLEKANGTKRTMSVLFTSLIFVGLILFALSLGSDLAHIPSIRPSDFVLFMVTFILLDLLRQVPNRGLFKGIALICSVIALLFNTQSGIPFLLVLAILASSIYSFFFPLGKSVFQITEHNLSEK